MGACPATLSDRAHANKRVTATASPACGLCILRARARPQGGLEAVQAANEAKAKVVYDAIAASAGFFASPVAEAARSLMNIPFTIPSRPELEKDFVAEASKRGMVRAAWIGLGWIGLGSPPALSAPLLLHPGRRCTAAAPDMRGGTNRACARWELWRRRCSSRATARWAACARRCTTPCRWTACGNWPPSCRRALEACLRPAWLSRGRLCAGAEGPGRQRFDICRCCRFRQCQ